MAENKATNQHSFRRLEDLNLIDNFLFQEMLSQEEDGEEFARILLKTILGKPIRNVKIIPQKNILGIDTDKHGIRLDAYIQEVVDDINGEMADAQVIPNVYDIEPNNSYEKETLPRRTRYYHGLIDSQLLSSGSGYDKLPNVVIIIILPYDPFNKNRMVYTIRNHCEEDTTIPYDDGAKKIYLYTKGTEGNPSQALKDMLKYIQESTSDNVTNDDIASMSRLIDKVKQRKGVGINYMKSWEIEEMIRKRATAEGLAEGRAKGLAEGLAEGRAEGLAEGRAEGLARVNLLNHKLSEVNRIEDILRATSDQAYQQLLFEEFNL